MSFARRRTRSARTTRSLAARSLIGCLTAVGLLALAPTAAVAAKECSGGKSSQSAMWLSIAHPGLGEYFLNGWGSFNENCPRKKFWLGFIPGYGWPGYLQVKSAIDAANCRTNDDLAFRD
jgi:hypothetical protein